ncbi:MAG: hypothetical protein N3E51_03680 [Candidatus Micrarchaeota archaeon]|nr:hypothetical protein [Candidatus Micrarchaeota archaeon]
MDVQEELSRHQVLLVLMPNGNYDHIALAHLKKLSKKPTCFVTLNKTYESLRELLEKKKISQENIVFIDAISKTIKSMPNQTKSCYFITSPTSLTEMQIAILRLMKHGFEYVIFDSLSSILVYQKNAPIGKFVSALSNNARQNKNKLVFYMVKSSQHKALVDELKMFVDAVLALPGA